MRSGMPVRFFLSPLQLPVLTCCSFQQGSVRLLCACYDTGTHARYTQGLNPHEDDEMCSPSRPPLERQISQASILVTINYLPPPPLSLLRLTYPASLLVFS